MKKIKMLAALLAFALLLAGCSTNGAGAQKVPESKKITPAEAKERLDSEKGIILLDVRTREEYEEKHIPGSILIPVDTIKEQTKDKLPDKNAVIFVYCRSGNRSATAAKALSSMGYTNVYDLGGIIDWPYETESGK